MRQTMGNIEQFISLIQSRPALYNMYLPEFSNKDVTDQLWEEVSTEFNTNVDYCKSKWAILRVSFARQMRNERANALARSEPLTQNWYLKDNMSFMREFMRKPKNSKKGKNKRKKKSIKTNNDALIQSSFELKQETILSNSTIPIKNEPILKDDNESSTSSLEFLDDENISEKKLMMFDCVSISSLSSVSNSETVQVENQIKESISYSVPSSSKPSLKRKASIQKDQSSDFLKTNNKKPDNQQPCKKKTNRQEDPRSTSLRNSTKIEERPSSTSDNMQQKKDATFTFFESILPDFNKLTGRRQRLLKQKLMANLNQLLDEQESQ